MTRGKITSQCAHALVSYFLGMVDRDQRHYRHPEVPSYWDAVQITLYPLDEDAFAEHIDTAHVTITDAGRTMFNGVPTITVCLNDDGIGTGWYQPNSYVHESAQYQTKQLIAVHRKHPHKAELSHDGVMASLHATRQAVDAWIHGEANDPLLYWWQHSFAKVTVQLPVDHPELEAPWISYGHAYALPPLFIADTEIYQSLKLF